jgi:hypothetical protein
MGDTPIKNIARTALIWLHLGVFDPAGGAVFRSVAIVKSAALPAKWQ